MRFNNNASHCMFIGNRRLDEVIAQDTRELEQIGGSFRAIAERMRAIHEWVRGTPYSNVKGKDFDAAVKIIGLGLTKGFQGCPFGCNCTSSDDVYTISNRTGKKLTLNPMTAHLAEEHHLLEKDNEYGIGAIEFYKGFMPEGSCSGELYIDDRKVHKLKNGGIIRANFGKLLVDFR